MNSVSTGTVLVVFVMSDEAIWTVTELPNNMSICVTNSKNRPEGLITFRELNIYSLENTIVEERFSILNAYYFPEEP